MRLLIVEDDRELREALSALLRQAGYEVDVQADGRDAWRQASNEADKVLTPAPWPLADCPANFGNSDVVSATTGR